MAEFLTMDEAKSKFGTKGRTNAGLTLGIIGTALAAFAGNNGGCGCGNGGGILGNLFGGNNNCCAMQAAENAKTLAMAQGQQADNLSWANRVQSMQDDIDLYTYVNSRALATNERIGNESQVLTNQIWKGRVEDLQEKSGMYIDLITRDNAQNQRLCDELYKRREQDVQEKADLFARLGSRISELENSKSAGSAQILADLTKLRDNLESLDWRETSQAFAAEAFKTIQYSLNQMDAETDLDAPDAKKMTRLFNYLVAFDVHAENF